jgi:hypothetical protein
MDVGGDEYTGTSFYCNKLSRFDIKERVWHEISPYQNGNDDTGFIPKGRRSHTAGK